MQNYQQNRLRPIIITFVCFMVGLTIIGILGASGIFHRNPYGNEIKINKFSRFFKDVPEDTRDITFANLYNQVAKTYHGDLNIKKLSANIRTDTVKFNDNPKEFPETISASFVVDLPEIEQCFHVSMEWPRKKDSNVVISYGSVVTCPSASENIYPSFECSDGFTDDKVTNILDQYPFLRDFPLYISYRDQTTKEMYDCEVRYKTNEDQTDVYYVITDRRGNCQDVALQRLKDAGVNTSTSRIDYDDISSGFWGNTR